MSAEERSGIWPWIVAKSDSYSFPLALGTAWLAILWEPTGTEDPTLLNGSLFSEAGSVLRGALFLLAPGWLVLGIAFAAVRLAGRFANYVYASLLALWIATAVVTQGTTSTIPAVVHCGAVVLAALWILQWFRACRLLVIDRNASQHERSDR